MGTFWFVSQWHSLDSLEPLLIGTLALCEPVSSAVRYRSN